MHAHTQTHCICIYVYPEQKVNFTSVDFYLPFNNNSNNNTISSVVVVVVVVEQYCRPLNPSTFILGGTYAQIATHCELVYQLFLVPALRSRYLLQRYVVVSIQTEHTIPPPSSSIQAPHGDNNRKEDFK